MATKLSNLRVEEISGVDDPANELPGWLVIKSKDGTVDEKATKEHAQLVFKNYAMLYSCLVAGLEYFDGAPDTVKSSVNDIVAFLEKVLTGEGAEEEAEETASAESAGDEADEKKFRTFITKLLRGAEAAGAESNEPEAEVAAKETETEELEAEATKESEPEAEVAAKETETEELEAETSKSRDDEITETLDVVKDVLGKIADRLETVEQVTAGRTSITGQEDDATKSNGGSSALTDAFRAASRGGKVTIR